MYTVGGESFLVVDAQVHIWDASPHNQAIPDGEIYALDLLRRHRELDGSGVPPHEVERVTERSLNRDVLISANMRQLFPRSILRLFRIR